jgi:hypothetical protein
MLFKFYTLFHTLSNLKPIQAIYQVKNRITKVGSLSSFASQPIRTQKLQFFDSPAIHTFLKVESSLFHFKYLNLSKSYPDSAVNWNDQSNGKLWNYNLQYLDFLKQEDISVEVKTNLVKDIYQWLWDGRLFLEPYPSSLRIMNIIRLLESHPINEEDAKLIKSYVLAELNYLSQNLEYHILANHLLENAFAWWMGALYFQNKDWIKNAGKLLKTQLDEQILMDGAHYELAPMYHQIILFRVMETYHLTPSAYVLKFVLKEKAELMLGWLEKMIFPNRTLPHFNDTTEGIAYSPEFLLETADSVGLKSRKISLNGSGYRIFESAHLKLVADVEGIKPSYQPGHAHADTFSFVLHHGNIPIVVDPGISTYTISPKRDWERSTLAHNTVTIDRKNSSKVWSGFRVGKRASVEILEENSNLVSAEHNGFGSQRHIRSFEVLANGIQIRDKIKNFKKLSLVEARFYFHPDIQPNFKGDGVIDFLNGLTLEILGASKLEILDYQFCLGFNNLSPAKYLLATFKGETLTSIFSLHK